MGAAVDAEQADGSRDGRLRRPWRSSLKTGQRFERPLVAHLAKRQRRIVLQRAVQLRHDNQRVDGIPCLVVAERLDYCATEEVFSPFDVANEGLLDAGRVSSRAGIAKNPNDGSQRPHERRSHEFAFFRFERGEESGRHGPVGIVLEVAVGDGAQPVIRAGQGFPHGVLRARIVEAGQQYKRAIADVAVGVLRYRSKKNGHCLGGGRPADRSSGGGAGRVIEVAELVHRRL